MKKAKALPWKLRTKGSLPSSAGIDASVLETEHVKRVYDNIAVHWSGTRYKPWPKVENFIRKQPSGTLFADVGCGNGKNLFSCNEDGFSIGTDFSENLLNVAKAKTSSFELSTMDILNLPLRNSSFDCLICIAVLHHISTLARRVQAISECIRILKPNGQALFYAWAKEQEHGEVKGVSGHVFQDNDVLVPWHLRFDTIGEEERNNVKERVKHATENNEKKAVVLQRYCHVYDKEEWENLFKQIENVKVEEIYWDTGNWVTILTKTRDLKRKLR